MFNHQIILKIFFILIFLLPEFSLNNVKCLPLYSSEFQSKDKRVRTSHEEIPRSILPAAQRSARNDNNNEDRKTKRIRKTLIRMEKNFARGDYKNALYLSNSRLFDGLEEISLVDDTASAFLAQICLYQAKYLTVLGLFSEAKVKIIKGLEILIQRNETDDEGQRSGKSLDYCKGLIQASEIYLLTHNYYKAGEYILKAENIILNLLARTWDETISQYTENLGRNSIEIKYLAVKINYFKGFLNETSKSIEDVIAYRKSKIKRKIQVKSAKTGEMKWKKIPAKQFKQKKRAYAEALNLWGCIYREKGNYQRADSILSETNNWIKKNLKKSDISYVDNLYSIAQSYNAKEQYINSAILYKKTISALEKKFAGLRYKSSHITYLDIQENWVRSYIYDDELRKAKNVLKKFSQRVALYYGKNNFHFAKIKRLEAEIMIAKGNFLEAELQLQALLNFKNLPANHIERKKVLELLYIIYLKTDKFSKAGDHLKQILEIGDNIYGSAAPNYHITKVKQAGFFVKYTSDFKKAEQIYDTSFYKVIKKQMYPHHKDYISLLNQVSKLYELTEKYSLANDRLSEACGIAYDKYGPADIHYIAQLGKLADLSIRSGDYKKAEKQIQTAIDLMERTTGRLGIEHAKVLETLARFYTVMGLYDDAEKTMNLSYKIVKKAGGQREVAIENIDDLTTLYLKTGRYFETENLLSEAIERREMKYGKSHLSLINPLKLLGNLYLITGDYAESEKSLERALSLSSKILGDTSVKYTEVLRQSGRLYSRMGDYEKAENIAQYVLDVQTKRLGKDHIVIANALTDLALVKYYQGQETGEIMRLMEQARDIVRNNFGEFHPQYAEALKNLALLYMDNKDFTRATGLLRSANEIWAEKLGKKNIHSADISLLKGAIFTEKGDFKNAKSNYVSAKSFYRKTFNKFHPDYANSLSKLSQMYYISGNYKKAIKILDETTIIYLTFINKYFPSLSDREKTKFWNHIKNDFEFYKTVAIKLKDKNPKLIGNIYDHTLIIKSILLNASIKVRERILNSGDEKLIGKYKEWVSKKELLTGILSLSNQELKESGIDVNALQKEINLLEKYLNESSELFARNYENIHYKWKDIRKSLQENEVAIEMIRFRYFDKCFTDSIIYAALIVTPQTTKYPDAVIFKNGKHLEGKYLKYYRNSVKFKAEDNKSYSVFWEPVKNRIDNDITVYFSAEGVYNQINLETMYSPAGNYVIDENNIVLISNTKDIILNKYKEKILYSTSTASLFGNPVFYISPKISNTATGSIFNNTTFSQLPGAESEVKDINELLKSKNWQTNTYIKYAATEQRVKNLESPRVLHFATHGFFMNDIIQFSESSIEEISEYKSVENPLLRSGLLLSGGGDLLNTKNIHNLNIGNGILTIHEAMNLNLDNTELVVLSACETALGEIQTGEGVYGLQRAFLVAGANTIIMSLFKISDDATKELMIIFYRKWLATGDKRKSFIDAKKKIRTKYKDPYYWGAFVMMGMD